MKKIYIYIFSIFFLFITNVNAVEDFEAGQAYQGFEVPVNEQWMVDRLSEQYPELEETDIFRIQTSFGTYYGAINNRGLPHGPGILSVSKDGVPTGTALEAEFKKGKLNDKDQFTLLGITDRVFEINNKGMMVAAKNRVFNNGFDLIANANFMIKASVSNLLRSRCNNATCERVHDNLENIINQDYSDNPIYLFIALENLLYDLLIEENENRYAWYRELDIRSGIPLEELRPFPIDPFLSLLGFNESVRYDAIKDRRRFYTRMTSSIAQILGHRGRRSIEDYMLELKNKGRTINADDPFHFSSMVLTNYLEDANEHRYRPWDNRPLSETQFEEFRLVNNFNFRKDKNEDVIQGKLNGKWYDLELNLESHRYQMTDSARRDFENNSGDRGSDGGSEGDGGGW